jgi:hypothetical protein
MPRSYMSDFIAGVDPTGTSTFQYGLEDARKGQESAARKAIGTVGGTLGGAAVLPGAIGGLVGGMKGLALGRGGLRGRLLSAGRHAVQGAHQPYTSLYRGLRAGGALKAHQAGKTLTPVQTGHLEKFVRGAVPKGVLNEGAASPQAIRSALNRMTPQQMHEARRHLSGELAAGAGALGMSGLVSGASAAMQYDKGALTGRTMNQDIARERFKQAGYRDTLARLSLI